MTLEELNQKFVMLVGMFEKDMTMMKNAVNTLQMEIAGCRAQIAQLGGVVATPPPDPKMEVVGRHPITGQPVTRGDIEKDPKLKLRMVFSENDA